MILEQILIDKGCGVFHRVILHLADLFEDHLFLIIKIILVDFQIEQYFFLVSESEVRMLGRQGYFEYGQVHSRVCVEISAVAAYILADLSTAPELSSPEQNVMLEDMD